MREIHSLLWPTRDYENVLNKSVGYIIMTSMRLGPMILLIKQSDLTAESAAIIDDLQTKNLVQCYIRMLCLFILF